MIFKVLSSWQSHCVNSLGVCDEYRRRYVAADLWNKPTGLSHRIAYIGSQ